MSAGLLLNAAPTAGFDAPFEMLDACHERVERSLRLLERLAQHLATHGADAQACDAARDVLRYFDLAAPQHHEDEERHVLPALRAHDQTALAERVQAEHATMAAAWARVRASLQAVERGDAAPALAARAAWHDFAALYRGHLALEERAVLPVARALLDSAAERAMGDDMARRRGVARP